MCVIVSAAIAVTCKKDVRTGLCMFFVIYAITPALFAYCHAYNTPCLKKFWHSHPYIFFKRFSSCFCDFFWSLIFSEDRQLHVAAANRGVV